MNLQEKVETKAPEFRLDQKERPRAGLKSSREGLGSNPAPGQRQGAESRKARNFMSIADRSTGEFNLRMAVVPRTGSASPALGFRTILDVENRGLL